MKNRSRMRTIFENAWVWRAEGILENNVRSPQGKPLLPLILPPCGHAAPDVALPFVFVQDLPDLQV